MTKEERLKKAVFSISVLAEEKARLARFNDQKSEADYWLAVSVEFNRLYSAIVTDSVTELIKKTRREYRQLILLEESSHDD